MSSPSPDDSLEQWLSWLEQLHPTEIDMGLQRVGSVADDLGLRPAVMPIILVGGTNGKGSTVALLAEIYKHAGLRVGAYTSPHIDTFNERMCVDGQMLDDHVIVEALHTVEQARKTQTLTYFEYTTLGAMVAFVRMRCDVVIMEVGLGGRLDATNLWDCDCAIITSIALDHQDYLGDTIEEIAAEKVAIGRAGVPMIVGELYPPANIINIARENKMRLVLIGGANLPEPNLAGVHQQRNAACALEAIDALQAKLSVSKDAIKAGLKSVSVAGRFERLTVDGQLVVLDVAHNPAAAETLSDTLLRYYPNHHIYAVFSALKDKDLVGIVTALAPAVSSWYCAELSVSRATPLSDLTQHVKQIQSAPVEGFESVASAWTAAKHAAANDTEKPTVILVAGSFYTLMDMRKIVSVNTPADTSADTSAPTSADTPTVDREQ